MERTWWSAIAVAMLASGCGREAAVEEPSVRATGGSEAGPVESGAPTPAPSGPAAVAELESGEQAQARRVEGTVTLTEQEGGGLLIEANVAGLEPGLHGFHVHEVGECSPPGFTSAGPHFAASGERHAGPSEPGHHLGDLGNIEVGENGLARYTILADQLTLEGGANAVVGKSVVIHAKRDDYATQPAGDSGDRVACGVIRRLE